MFSHIVTATLHMNGTYVLSYCHERKHMYVVSYSHCYRTHVWKHIFLIIKTVQTKKIPKIPKSQQQQKLYCATKIITFINQISQKLVIIIPKTLKNKNKRFKSRLKNTS